MISRVMDSFQYGGSIDPRYWLMRLFLELARIAGGEMRAGCTMKLSKNHRATITRGTFNPQTGEETL